MSEPAMMMEDHDGGDREEKKKKGMFSRFKKKKDKDHEEHKKHKKDKKSEAHQYSERQRIQIATKQLIQVTGPSSKL